MPVNRMRVHRLVAIGLASIILMTVLRAGVAQAIPVTFHFEGTILGPVSPPLNPPIVPNTPISGSYTFESTTPDLSPDTPIHGLYALTALSVELLGNTYSMGTTGLRVIDIVSDPRPGNDLYAVGAILTGPSINGLSPLRFVLGINTADLPANDALPLTPPSLTSEPGANFVSMDFGTPSTFFFADGQLTNLTAVPEPSALELTGLGLLGLIGFEMRRRWAAGTR